MKALTKYLLEPHRAKVALLMCMTLLVSVLEGVGVGC